MCVQIEMEAPATSERAFTTGWGGGGGAFCHVGFATGVPGHSHVHEKVEAPFSPQIEAFWAGKCRHLTCYIHALMSESNVPVLMVSMSLVVLKFPRRDLTDASCTGLLSL